MHHAILNILESIFISTFTSDTYSSIKGRGIHQAVFKVKDALKDEVKTKYCLKLDIKKFYPSINNEILKILVRRKFKDKDLLWLLDEIIDSMQGMPIGNYLSQYLANYYLSGFDHWIKEVKKIKSYFRYADDIVILAESKEELHEIFHSIKYYLKKELDLEVKKNYQIFPVKDRGIDFLGYKFYHGFTKLRKSIKKRFARAISKNCGMEILAGYKGWCKFANTRHLIKKLLNENVQIVWH